MKLLSLNQNATLLARWVESRKLYSYVCVLLSWKASNNMASRGEIAPQKLQEERHTPGRAGGKCATVIVHKLFHAQR